MRKKNERTDISLISQAPSQPRGGGTSRISDNGDDRLLRIDEAARLLGLSVGGLYHLVSQSRIPVVRISSRCIRFSRRALSEWIESLTEPPEHTRV